MCIKVLESEWHGMVINALGLVFTQLGSSLRCQSCLELSSSNPAHPPAANCLLACLCFGKKAS
jgi:hypothetical protein